MFGAPVSSMTWILQFPSVSFVSGSEDVVSETEERFTAQPVNKGPERITGTVCNTPSYFPLDGGSMAPNVMEPKEEDWRPRAMLNSRAGMSPLLYRCSHIGVYVAFNCR